MVKRKMGEEKREGRGEVEEAEDGQYYTDYEEGGEVCVRSAVEDEGRGKEKEAGDGAQGREERAGTGK